MGTGNHKRKCEFYKLKNNETDGENKIINGVKWLDKVVMMESRKTGASSENYCHNSWPTLSSIMCGFKINFIVVSSIYRVGGKYMPYFGRQLRRLWAVDSYLNNWGCTVEYFQWFELYHWKYSTCAYQKLLSHDGYATFTSPLLEEKLPYKI